MSLILRGNVWHIRKMIKGQTLAESTHTGNRRLAEQIMAKRVSELTQDVVLAGKKPIKLHDAIDLFVKSRTHLTSYQSCEILLRYFKQLPNHYVDRVTDEEIETHLQAKRDLGYEDSTLKSTVSYFNAMLNYCDRHKYTVRKRVKLPKVAKKRIRWLTKDELKQLFDALDVEQLADPIAKALRQENADLVRLLYETGARYSEIADMRWNQVDLVKGTVLILRKKGSIDGTLMLTKAMKDIFTRRRAMEKGHAVFSSKEGKYNEDRWFNAAVKRAGLDETPGKVTLHKLRHTKAVHLLQAGMNLLEVKTFLGHADIASTMVYVHVIEDEVMAKAARLAVTMEEIEEKEELLEN